MTTAPSEPRYVLAVGDACDEVASHPDVIVIQRLDHAVLVEASMNTAAQLRRTGRPHVHVYRSEEAARVALALFRR
jgi:hypothetical protein